MRSKTSLFNGTENKPVYHQLTVCIIFPLIHIVYQEKSSLQPKEIISFSNIDNDITFPLPNNNSY